MAQSPVDPKPSTVDELFRRVRDGDQTAEKTLFRQLFVRFRLFAEQEVNSQEAADVAQRACIAIHEKYLEEQFTKSFGAWAYGVFRNTLLKSHQTARKEQKRQEVLVDVLPEQTSSIDESFLKDALRACMRKLMDSFPRYGRILNLKYQGFATDDVCVRLKISSDQYYVYLGRGRSLLRSCLEERGFSV